MRYLSVSILLLGLGCIIDNFNAKAQTGPDSEVVYTVVEETPQYPGGQQALYKEISGNIKYPEQARRAGIEGRVFISFVIDKQGNMSNAKVEKGIGAGCDEEALRVVKELSHGWQPARQAGKPVNYRFVLPIKFTLVDRQPPADITTPTEYVKGEPVMRMVSELPTYKGGEEALNKEIGKKLKRPRLPEQQAKQGVVFTSFIIDKKGRATGHRIESGLGPAYDKEALRVVKSLKKWQPAKAEGKPVHYRYVQQIKFVPPNQEK